MDDNTHLRQLLFMSHPCPGRYGDDGEMQCGACRIDFKRDPPEFIERRLIEAAFRRNGEPLNCPCGDEDCGDIPRQGDIAQDQEELVVRPMGFADIMKKRLG